MIDCLTFSSKSGGITAEILVDILKYFNRKKIFPQIPGGPIPFLLVDGHNTQLDPTFIAYINNIEHCWKVCFGVPYGTLLWQGGDSAENNGTFESEFYGAKDELLLWKYEPGLTRAIKHKDVMPLLNDIFPKAFGHEEINKKAITDQG